LVSFVIRVKDRSKPIKLYRRIEGEIKGMIKGVKERTFGKYIVHVEDEPKPLH